MATIKYGNVKVTAISACVPKTVKKNIDLDYLIPREEIEKTINSIGIQEKRFVEEETCPSDLCFKAAEKLFADNNIDRNSIDLILFLSQSPDYKIPTTAPILQKRLGLPTTTAALDLSLGCSGYVYGLSTAMAYASMEGISRVLFLDGEAFSRIVNPMDKVDAPLYGDAGTATLVEKTDIKNSSIFLLCTDGSGEGSVKIKDGGARCPFSAESLIERKEKDGSIHRDSEVYMNGMEVFNFVMLRIPRNIKDLCAAANINVVDANYLILHQANKFMTDFIAKRLRYPLEKVPYCLDKYGNTSSPSIPLTISSELYGKKIGNVIISGFGAGLSWGSAYLNLDSCHVSKVIEY